MTVKAKWESPWYLISCAGDIDFRSVEKQLLDESGNPVEPEEVLDPDTGEVIGYTKRTIDVLYYQRKLHIRRAKMTLQAAGLTSITGEMSGVIGFMTSADSSGTFAGNKKFMCVHDELQNDDRILGTGMLSEDWVFYDKWKKVPKSWAVVGEPDDAPEEKSLKKEFASKGADALKDLSKLGLSLRKSKKVDPKILAEVARISQQRREQGLYVPGDE
jgi:hypothetical protein